MRAGNVYVNYPASDTAAPLGGYKQSGNGREYGKWALDEFLEVKAVIGCAAAQPEPAKPSPSQPYGLGPSLSRGAGEGLVDRGAGEALVDRGVAQVGCPDEALAVLRSTASR